MATGPGTTSVPTSPGKTNVPSVRQLRRDVQHRVLGGVCAGIARYLNVDPLFVRIAFVVGAAAGGTGVIVYALAWVLIPAADSNLAGEGPRPHTGRAAVEVALGMSFIVLSALLLLRAAGIWFSDAVVWPLLLVAIGAALIWRQSLGASETQSGERASIPAGPSGDRVERAVAPSAAVVSRTGLGIALVLAAGLVFLEATGSLSAARDVVLAVLVVVVILAVIFAPWIIRLARSLASERAERIRSQERAEMAAHLHDSVLQTLALVQKRVDRPGEVASLARRQERELRAWLSNRDSAGTDSRQLVGALESIAEEAERTHGARVEVVGVGDCEIDDHVEGLIAAAREAVVNAAKFGGGSPIDVYGEVTPDRLQVFVRDRGPGFDRASVPPDRRGVRESIMGRMARHGGHASIQSSPGAGTEIELVLPRKEAPRPPA